MKYKLTVLEKVDYRHDVTIETEHEIEGLCDFLQDEVEGSSGVLELVIKLQNHKLISKMLKVLSYDEDQSGQSEWEIEDYEKNPCT